MSNNAIRLNAEPLRSLAGASILAGYVGVGTPLLHPARQILVQNLTDALVVFSFDAVNDHFVLPANGFFLDDITSNKSVTGGIFCLAENVRLYVKQSGVPNTGAVYFSVFYGSE